MHASGTGVSPVTNLFSTHRRDAGATRAFTLLEILLVLALLVVIAAVATPSIARFARTQELRSAGDVVRGEWARARVQAMKSGRVHVFVFEPDGSRYSVDYWIADDDALEAGDSTSQPAAEATEPEGSGMLAEELPQGVRFMLGDSEATARSAEVEADLPAAGGAETDVTWSRPILFYSDGTTSTAEITLANEQGRAVRVSLRGLTGVAKVGEVFDVEGAGVAE